MKETDAYKNLAKGILVTGSTGIINPDVITNGDTQADSGSGVDREFGYSSVTGLQYVQIDLGATFPVNKVIVWHYNRDGRTYHNTKTQVSANGSTWVTVFDSATQGEYAETLAGKTHTFTQQNVRYVRDYLNGSTVNTGNHWTEIEVWGTATTAYVGDYYEWNGSAETMTRYYYAGGTRVAVRNSNGTGTNGLVYLLGDHLGSTSLTADPVDGDRLSELRFKAWGETRYTLTNAPTDRRFTGQVDDSYINLYWYESRWYDPALGRFLSPDSIVPGTGEDGNPNAVGYLGASTYSNLTVDYHEIQFLAQQNQENRARLQDPHFRLPPVPTNTIAFDRYAYSLNNPVRYVDPSGHFAILAALALITPVGWVAIGVTAIGVGLYFAVPGVREAVTNSIYQIGEATADAVEDASTDKRNDENQEALVDLAQEAKQKGSVSEEDAQTLMDWADEYNVLPHTNRVEQHPNRNFKLPHIRIGPVNHIPVTPR